MKVKHTISRSSTKEGRLSRCFQIVTEYSVLDLTFGKDKLPALSGVAKQLKQSNNETYLAGLWLSDLVRCLCWYNDSTDAVPGAGSHDIPVPWRAPSWSWAHIDGRIKFFTITDDCNLVTICDAYCDNTSGDETGVVTSGRITLSGQLAPASLRRYTTEDLETGDLSLHAIDSSISGTLLAGARLFLDFRISAELPVLSYPSCLPLGAQCRE